MMIILVAVLCLSGGYVSAQAPSFCKGAECPHFTILSTSQGYETRQYGPLTWAATSYTGSWNENVLGVLFGRLYQYIQGNNSFGQLMSMTVPVLTRIESAGHLGTKYTMQFMVPAANIGNIARPTDTKISIMTEPSANYIVKSFRGFANGQIYMSELQELVNSINNTQLYNNNVFFTATYDSPTVTTNRHNEVWLKLI